MKKRPRGIPDVHKRTINTRTVKEDFLRQSTTKKLTDDKNLKEKTLKEVRFFDNRFSNLLEEEDRQRALVDAKRLDKARQLQMQHESILRNTQLLQKEKLERGKLVDDKRKMQILQNNADFQEFQSHLKAAHTGQEQLSQIKAREMDRSNTKEDEKQQMRILQRRFQELEAVETQQRHMARMQRREYQEVLLNQMKNQNCIRRETALKERELENKLLEDRNKMSAESGQRALESLRTKRNESKGIYEEYLQHRNERCQLERTQSALEVQRVQEHLRRQQERIRQDQDTKIARQTKQEDLKDKVGRIIWEERERRLKEESQILRKQEREVEDRRTAKERKNYQLDLQRRHDLHSDQIKQLKQREQQLYLELAQQERYRQKFQAKLVNNQAENKSGRTHNIKQLDYLKELQRMMDEMRKRTELEKNTGKDFFRVKMERDAAIDQFVESEKQRLLKLEAANIFGHLPKSALRSAARSPKRDTFTEPILY